MHLSVYLSTYVAFAVITVVTRTYFILLRQKEVEKIYIKWNGWTLYVWHFKSFTKWKSKTSTPTAIQNSLKLFKCCISLNEALGLCSSRSLNSNFWALNTISVSLLSHLSYLPSLHSLSLTTSEPLQSGWTSTLLFLRSLLIMLVYVLI